MCSSLISDASALPCPAAIDPRSLAIWNQYTTRCSNANYATSGATPAECAGLSGGHCSRSDVKCEEKDAVFYDTKNLKAKRAILRGDYNIGLVYFAPQPPPPQSGSSTGGSKQPQKTPQTGKDAPKKP